MTATLSPEVIDMLPVLKALPAEEKNLVIRVLSDSNAEIETLVNERKTLTLAEFSEKMKKRNLAKGQSLTVEDMNAGIANMFKNWES